jgi:hypothetical protein
MHLLLFYFGRSLPDHPSMSGYFFVSQTGGLCASMWWTCAYAEYICIASVRQIALHCVMVPLTHFGVARSSCAATLPMSTLWVVVLERRDCTLL